MDRAFARFVLVLFGVLALAQACAGRTWAREPGLVAGDYCDSIGERTKWSAADKARTRARVQAACEELGASQIVCVYMDVIVCRESYCGAASIRHTRGHDADGVPEHGLGPMGLSLRWHANKWPGDDEDPAFCTPEASVVVAHEIFWSAVTRYGADSIADVQAIYAGRFRCAEIDRWAWVARIGLLGPIVHRRLPKPRSECMPAPTARGEANICQRMVDRGFNCHARIGLADLGRRLPIDERRAWALTQAARY